MQYLVASIEGSAAFLRRDPWKIGHNSLSLTSYNFRLPDFAAVFPAGILRRTKILVRPALHQSLLLAISLSELFPFWVSARHSQTGKERDFALSIFAFIQQIFFFFHFFFLLLLICISAADIDLAAFQVHNSLSFPFATHLLSARGFLLFFSQFFFFFFVGYRCATFA